MNISEEAGELEVFIPNTFDRFEKCKLLRNDKVFLQLSLYAIRESIEQPIGSPRLMYKNKKFEEKFDEMRNAWSAVFSIETNTPLVPSPPIAVSYSYDMVTFVFIPDFPRDILNAYKRQLISYIAVHSKKIFEDASRVVLFLFTGENSKNKSLKEEIHDALTTNQRYIKCLELQKIQFRNIDSLQLQFNSQISDFIDSVGKICYINRFVSSQNDEENFDFDFKKTIDLIGKRPWTEKKETIRTIEHYRKLLFDGDNSTFKSIHKIANEEYQSKLKESVSTEDEFKKSVYDYYYIDKIINDDAESYDKFTSHIALLYLFENKRIEESLKQLLELCKNDYRFDIDKDDPIKEVNFKNLLIILTKNKKDLDTHFSNFDLNSSFLSRLCKFTETLLNDDDLNSIVEYYTYLKHKTEANFIKSYHTALGGYLLPELTESIYNLTYLRTLSVSDLVISINNDLNLIETSLSEIRVNIVSKLDELKSILEESQSLSSYPEKLSKAIKGISIIKSIIDNSPKASTLLVVNSIIKHFNKVVNDSEIFLKQLEEIFDDISEQKSIVDTIQDEIDALYNDPLTERLLGFSYPKKRNDNYLWKKKYLADNLKSREEFEKLFGESKNYYNPFTSPTIFPDKIKTFYQCLVTITNKLNPEFKEMASKMKEIKKTSESTTQLQNFITQLLIPVEE